MLPKKKREKSDTFREYETISDIVSPPSRNFHPTRGFTIQKFTERNPFGDLKPTKDSCNEPSPANYDVMNSERAIRNGFRLTKQ